MDNVQPSPPEVCICWPERVVLQSDQSFRLFENLSRSTDVKGQRSGKSVLLLLWSLVVLWNKKNVRKIGKGKESKAVVRVHCQHM